jgi:DNA-binding SARP family transcriptional activator
VSAAVQLHLGLFGALSVAVCLPHETAAHPVALGGRPGGLLALLVMTHGRFSSRTDLARELWSGPTEACSAGSCNTLLWRLRRALETPPLHAGDVIECDRQGALRIAECVQVDNDVEHYRRLIEPPMGKPVERLDAGDVEALRCAVSLYRGDVLASFRDDWALRLREKHRRLQLGALARLMHVCSLHQDWPEAVAHGEAILELDELREDVHRELMRCHLACGQRALALRQFERCRSALRRELAIHPMQETLQLHQQIADAAVGVAAMPPMPAGQGGAGLHLPPVWPGTASPQDAAHCIQQARWHLAQADAQLQLSLFPHA